MTFAVERALDELYAAAPDRFTSLRAQRVAAAKKAGDRDAAARIAASRKPTTAAWVVNALALAGSARDDLTGLGSRLREAHAAMDGDAIRSLSAEQRALVDSLARAALLQSGLTRVGATLRDDVTATLQAAVADPEVAARLGRLEKAEQWSGFGDFGVVSTVSTPSRFKGTVNPTTNTTTSTTTNTKVESRADSRARAALAGAERARNDADAALGELQSDLARARLRHQDAQRRLSDARDALTAAEDAYDAGKRAAHDASEAWKAARRAATR